MNSVKGTAIYIPVCSHNICCTGTKKHHLTLTHLDTQDQNIIDLVLHHIREFIRICGVSEISYTIGKEGKRSTLIGGDIEDFKSSLDNYLRSEKEFSHLISPYRQAHIDRFDREIKYYKKFRVGDLRIMSDH